MDSSAKTSLEAVEDDRTGLSVPALRRACADNLYYVQGKFPAIATKNDFYMALAYTVRDRQLHRWINTLPYSSMIPTHRSGLLNSCDCS
jgi:glycogen phosphorylase